MVLIAGKGASGGKAIGRARFWRDAVIEISQEAAADADAEWRRLVAARDAAALELEALYEQTLRTVGEESAEIFSVQAMMARDEDFVGEIRAGILERRRRAEYAVMQAKEQYMRLFLQMEDEYMRERATDVGDVAGRILRHLQGRNGDVGEAEDTPYILCAEDLTPSQTVGLDRRAVAAFVTAHGSIHSHSAILARTMNLPAVIDVGKDELAKIKDGTMLAVDGDRGVIYVAPDEEICAEWAAYSRRAEEEQARLLSYRHRASVTPDGRRLEVAANVGNLSDVRAACEAGAEGIGLFRSEFLYLGREDYPDEEEQFAAYREALSAMPDRRVVIRTLDIGADKQAPYFALGEQENPALGLRACRVSLARPQVFLTQARALLRASVFGRLAVMFPLITGEGEVTGLLNLWEEAKRELAARGMTWSERIEMGIMIETPAAAILSDRLATMVDFFSIGTNDLTQYTLAMDRQNAALSESSRGRQESVLRLIRYTVQSARRAGIWVGVCGEMAADVTMTKELLDMGVTELSVSPGAVLALRERICTMPSESGRVADEKEEKDGHF